MMLKLLHHTLQWFWIALRKNFLFFLSMYLLGCMCAWLTLPHQRNATLYENLYPELFVDVFLGCMLLTLLPRKVRRWVRRIAYVLLYGIAVADVYCFARFGSTLNPTMLLLVGETDAREASEFIRTYLSPDVLFSAVGWIVLLMVAHALLAQLHRLWKRMHPHVQKMLLDTERGYAWVAGGILLAVFVWCASLSAFNKEATWHIMTRKNVGEMERLLTGKHHVELYKPVDRLLFSLRANSVAAAQLDKLTEGIGRVQVDSCSFRIPSIVLIIGESYGKTHSALYGYPLNTTPRQVERAATGRLIPFTDVISSWNLTSFVFKDVFSMHTVGQEGEWCDYPLFPELYKKAGYQVTFLTNQFLPQAKEKVYDFSGGFFLNNEQLSDAMFTVRNNKVHRYDKALLDDYDQLVPQSGPRFTIFHLMGQHVNYKQRTPVNRRYFMPSDYKDFRPDLTQGQQEILCAYDNATHYNDSIVDLICKRFEGQDAVVIYMPDHGEECYEGKRKFFCRNHAAAVDYELAHYEFDIPFWMWCSESFVNNHPDVFEQIKAAKDRPLMTDALAHTLVWLAGISTPSYDETCDILSPNYNAGRKRLIKNTVDYDSLKPSSE